MLCVKVFCKEYNFKTAIIGNSQTEWTGSDMALIIPFKLPAGKNSNYNTLDLVPSFVNWLFVICVSSNLHYNVQEITTIDNPRTCTYTPVQFTLAFTQEVKWKSAKAVILSLNHTLVSPVEVRVAFGADQFTFNQ